MARWRGLAAASDGVTLRTVGDLPFNNEGFQHLELKKKQFSLQSPPRTPHQRGGGGRDELGEGGCVCGGVGGGVFLAAADCQVRVKAAVFVRGLRRQQLLVIAGYFWQFDVSSVLLGHRRSLGRWGGQALGGAVTCMLNGFIFSLSPDLTCLLTHFPLLLHFGGQTSAWEDTSKGLDLALMSAQIQASAKSQINQSEPAGDKMKMEL